MTDAVWSRPPFNAEERAAFKNRHVAEREGDGMAPVFALRHRHDDEEARAEATEAIDYPGEVLDSPTAKALVDSLAVAHVQENSLLHLADAKAKEEGYQQGERAGVVKGLDIAKQITDALKAEIKASRDPIDSGYIETALDDLAVRFIERSAVES